MWEKAFSHPSTSEQVKSAQNTEKSVSAIRAAEIFISTSSEEADETTKLTKLPIITRI